jgi:hypothetical protein
LGSQPADRLALGAAVEVESQVLKSTPASVVVHAVAMDDDAASEWVAEFQGTVHPQGWAWGLDEPLELTFADSQWAILLLHSSFRVVVRGAPPVDLPTFVNEVMSIVRGVLDSLSFHLGVVLTPELTGGFASPGLSIVPGKPWDELTGREPSAPLRVDAETLQPFVRTSTAEPLVRLALADLAAGMERPDDTMFYAFRAVETVRQFLAQPGDSSSSQWQRLRETFGLDEAELRWLTDHSVPRRHGELVTVTAADRVRALTVARSAVRALVELVDVGRADGAASAT